MDELEEIMSKLEAHEKLLREGLRRDIENRAQSQFFFRPIGYDEIRRKLLIDAKSRWEGSIKAWYVDGNHPMRQRLQKLYRPVVLSTRDLQLVVEARLEWETSKGIE